MLTTRASKELSASMTEPVSAIASSAPERPAGASATLAGLPASRILMPLSRSNGTTSPQGWLCAKSGGTTSCFSASAGWLARMFAASVMSAAKWTSPPAADRRCEERSNRAFASIACHYQPAFRCHPERSEGSLVWARDPAGRPEILRCAQNDMREGLFHGIELEIVRRDAAIDDEPRAGCPGRLVRGEVERHINNIIRRAETSK